MHHPHPVFDLIAALYQVTTEPNSWPVVLKSITQFFNGHAAFITNIGENAHASPDLYFYNLPLESIIAYGGYYYQYDLWGQSFMNRELAIGTVGSSDQMVEKSIFNRSIWFNEFLRPLDVGHTLYTSLSEGTPNPAILAIDRPINAEPFSKVDRDAMRQLSQHFVRALAISKQFQALNTSIQAHTNAISHLNTGIVTLNMNAKVLFANEIAVSMLGQQDGLVLKHGFLTAVTNTCSDNLALILALAKQGISHVGRLIRRPPFAPLAMKSLPLELVEQHENLSDAFKYGKVLLLLTEEKQSPNYAAFAKAHHLTRQELKVLQAMVEGLSSRQLADYHQVSYNTIRSQLASLLQKTACKSQKDLVRYLITYGI